MKSLAVTLLAALALGVTPLASGAAPRPSCCSAEAVPAHPTTGPLSSLSVTDQRGDTVRLADGHVWIVTFFYGTCKTACPRLLYNMAEVYDAMPAADRARVQFAAITFDPQRDTPERLVTLASEHNLEAATIHVARGDAAATLMATKACGFEFKADGEGGFLHSNLIAIVDGTGTVKQHFYGLEPDISRIVSSAHRLL